MKEIGMNDIVGATAVAAYSYMALVPLIQPPIIKFFTTQKERQIVMPPAKNEVSKRAKILFPIICTAETPAAPIIGFIFSLLTKFISFANNIPAIVAEINATRPSIKIAIVSNCKNTSPGIVDPTANPRIITTIFINSFCAVLLNLSTSYS